MNEQPVNLRASMQEIWRRRLLVVVVATLCGLGGLTYALLRPPTQTAVALVLVPPSAVSGTGAASGTGATGGTGGGTGGTGNGIATQAVIAKSTPVLAAAGAKVSPRLGALGVEKLVTVTPLSGQILQIQAQGPKTSYAVRLANAVAASYDRYVGQLETDSLRTAEAALRHEAAQLNQQIKNLQTQINTVNGRLASESSGSSQAQQDTNLLASLRSEQNQAALQLDNVTSQATSARVKSGSTTSGARVLQPASAQAASGYGFAVEAAIIAFAIGVLGAVVFILVRLQRDHRLRFRDEIARTAGAPVIASLDAPTCTTVSAWQDLLARGPRATTEWSLRNLLHSLVNNSQPGRTVRVISFAGDFSALATGPQLALYAAASGMQTALVPEAPAESKDRSLAPLWAAVTSTELVDRGLPLSLGLSDVNHDLSELVVVLAVFHRHSTVLTPLDGINLLSISANAVADEDLAQFALQTNDNGMVVEGVVVVNPDPSDNTTGSVKNDTVRLLPSRTGSDGSHDLAHLGSVTSDAGASLARFSPKET